MHLTEMLLNSSLPEVGGKEPDHLESLGCVPDGPGFLLDQEARIPNASISISMPLLVGGPIDGAALSLNFSFLTCKVGRAFGPTYLPGYRGCKRFRMVPGIE